MTRSSRRTFVGTLAALVPCFGGPARAVLAQTTTNASVVDPILEQLADDTVRIARDIRNTGMNSDRLLALTSNCRLHATYNRTYELDSVLKLRLQAVVTSVGTNAFLSRVLTTEARLMEANAVSLGIAGGIKTSFSISEAESRLEGLLDSGVQNQLDSMVSLMQDYDPEDDPYWCEQANLLYDVLSLQATLICAAAYFSPLLAPVCALATAEVLAFFAILCASRCGCPLG